MKLFPLSVALSSLLLNGSLPVMAQVHHDSGHPEEQWVAQASVLLQRQGTLERGDEVLPSDGSLYDIHTFEGRAGQRVTIRLESNEFDTYLAIIGPNDEVLAENDDFDGSTNSSVTLTFPETGTYTIVANGYDSSSRGRYALVVSGSGSGPSNTAQTLANLPNGDYVFEGPPAPDMLDQNSMLLVRKSGNMATGFLVIYMSENPCFRGTLSGNSVAQVTYATAPYGELGWLVEQGEPINLNEFRLVSNQITGRDREFFQECLAYFNN